jgi:hypothetical protein
MTARLVLGLGWALLTGLAGVWLAVSPWTLAQQQGGDWTAVTRTELLSGIGLVLLALVGVAVVTVQTVRSLREAGVLTPRTRSDAPATSTSPDMERALIALAEALADDLDARRPAGGRP